jgi:hypothetical protein
LAFAIAMMTASIYSDLEAVNDSRRWLATAESIADKIPSLRENFEYLVERADIASGTCDLAELQMIYKAARQLGIPSSNHRLRRWAFALRALIDHLAGEDMDSMAAIEELTARHRNEDVGDIADFEIAVALKISLKAERRKTTALRLHQYLKHRRPRPHLAMLQQIASELEQAGQTKSR